MKKLLIAPLCLASLVGCNANNTNTQPEEPEKNIVSVILLYGQSNMSGVALRNVFEQRFPADYNDVKDGFSNCKIRYISDSNHNKSIFDFEDVKLGQGYTSDHFGPELGLAKYLKTVRPNETFYFIKYAIGGTSLHIDWNSPSMVGSDGRVYKDAMAFTDGALKTLEENGFTPKIRAICWMQGEEDSTHQEQIGNYESNTTAFISGLRKKFDQYKPDKDIYFIDAGISSAWDNYSPINQVKQRVANKKESNVFIDSIANNLEYDKEPTPEQPDRAHFDSKSEYFLGELFGAEIHKIL